MRKYYETNINRNAIIVMSQYAGRSYVGIAKCHPDDEYDFMLGKELAKNRCDIKILKAKLKNAENRLVKAQKCVTDALVKARKASVSCEDVRRKLGTCIDRDRYYKEIL